TNFDRLYLAKLIPLDVLGIFGIARSISELLTTLFQRLGSVVLFPFIASHRDVARDELRRQLSPLRARALFVAALGFSILVANADLLVKLVYDTRYWAAAWMLPLLLVGSWFSVLTSLNEAILMGIGKPSYSALSNSIKLAFLIIGLPFGF